MEKTAPQKQRYEIGLIRLCNILQYLVERHRVLQGFPRKTGILFEGLNFEDSCGSQLHGMWLVNKQRGRAGLDD